MKSFLAKKMKGALKAAQNSVNYATGKSAATASKQNQDTNDDIEEEKKDTT